ncbi:MAG: serine/threonine protein kinase [Anaerolineales bacterium]|nr:serine/threonine protein kinase [Anaerolineales bacterium]
MSLRPGDIFGPYTVERPLSDEGGMSQVLLAYDTERTQYKAALKVQLSQNDNSAAFQDLLRHESNILQTLRHPGIVRIFPLRIDSRVTYTARAAMQTERPWYFAMEYIAGASLDQYTKQIGRFPLSWTIELFYQLLVTIDFIHGQGYAHCDLKPQNIMFRQEPQRQQTPAPILIDFGSATELKRGVQQLAASIRYSPPEVILALDRKDIPARALLTHPQKIDIWALGAILFEVVTGRPLIPQHRKEEITTTILQGHLDDMRTHRPETHKSLDTLLHKMLHRQPTERPDTKTIIKAIEEHIHSIRPPRIGG